MLLLLLSLYRLLGGWLSTSRTRSCHAPISKELVHLSLLMLCLSLVVDRLLLLLGQRLLLLLLLTLRRYRKLESLKQDALLLS